MDRSEVIFLLSETVEQDEMGVFRKTVKDRMVFAQVDSITRSEFFEAGRNGLNPDFRFTIFAGDYEGEKTLRYKSNEYGIYRTYLARNDNLELYAERKGGVDGGTEQ